VTKQKTEFRVDAGHCPPIRILSRRLYSKLTALVFMGSRKVGLLSLASQNYNRLSTSGIT